MYVYRFKKIELLFDNIKAITILKTKQTCQQHQQQSQHHIILDQVLSVDLNYIE